MTTWCANWRRAFVSTKRQRFRIRPPRFAAYARIRDDVDSEIKFSELRLNATQKLGELSRDLDKEKPGPKDTAQRGAIIIGKAKVLADAGISHGTAQRAEELAGGPNVNGQVAAMAASDKYFAESRQSKTPPTMKGLRKVVREAVRATVGEPKPRGKPAPKPTPACTAISAFANVDFVGHQRPLPNTTVGVRRPTWPRLAGPAAPWRQRCARPSARPHVCRNGLPRLKGSPKNEHPRIH